MFVPLGGRIKIEDLVQGMVVQSGNDACVVLAEGLAGSEQAFVEQMNQKGQADRPDATAISPMSTGCPDPDHWMTARDLAILAVRTIQDFPEYYKYLRGEGIHQYNNINQGNRNPLLYKDLGADGLKTGHTEEAGYSLLASVKRGDRRIVLVLSGLPSMKARAQESERLIEWAFREYNNYKLFSGRREDRRCRGLARGAGQGAADCRQGPGRDPAAQVAQGHEGHASTTTSRCRRRSRRGSRSARSS